MAEARNDAYSMLFIQQMKGEIFLWSVSKITYLNSLLKSALTGKMFLILPLF